MDATARDVHHDLTGRRRWRTSDDVRLLRERGNHSLPREVDHVPEEDYYGPLTTHFLMGLGGARRRILGVPHVGNDLAGTACVLESALGIVTHVFVELGEESIAPSPLFWW